MTMQNNLASLPESRPPEDGRHSRHAGIALFGFVLTAALLESVRRAFRDSLPPGLAETLFFAAVVNLLAPARYFGLRRETGKAIRWTISLAFLCCMLPVAIDWFTVMGYLGGTHVPAWVNLLRSASHFIGLVLLLGSFYWALWAAFDAQSALLRRTRELDREVSERKRVEAEHQRAHVFREAIIENSAEGLCVCHPTDAFPHIAFVVWNKRMMEITGYTMDEINRFGWYQSLYPDPDRQARAIARMEQMRHGNNLVQEEWRITRKDGAHRILSISTSLLEGFGEAPHVLGIMADITQTKEAEIALAREVTLRRAIFDQTKDGITLLNNDGTVFDANQAMAGLLGYTREELHELQLSDWDTALAPQDTASLLQTLPAEGATFERVHRRKDGTRYDAEVSHSRIESGDRILYCGVHRDITPRKRAEAALMASEARYRRIVDTASEGIWMIDEDRITTFVNARVESMLGYNAGELLGKRIEDLVWHEDLPVLNAQIAKCQAGLTSRYDLRFRHKSGLTVWAHISGAPVFGDDGRFNGSFTMLTDITESKQAEEQRRRLEAQLLHAQKLESIGVLAGGIAHDFNNILTGILSNTELALEDLTEQSPAAGRLRIIETSARRAADLTRQLLAYSGKGRYEMRELRISDIVPELVNLVEASMSKKCEIRCHLDPDLPFIEADVPQMRQAIMNLLVNATEAIGDQDGVITVTTGCATLDRDYLSGCYLDDDLPKGDYVTLEVTDSGPGIADEVYGRLFDPFFSTKFLGRGLGLAAVMGIVRNHRGAIRVSSQPHHGTAFTLVFPARTVLASGGPAELDGANKPAARGGTVLVVDDEEIVRNAAAAALQRAGYRVVTASDGVEAVEKYRTHQHNIEVVLLDLVMPRMDGSETFQAIRRIDKNVRIILSSGFSEEETLARLGEQIPEGFIHKPYRLADLLNIIKQSPQPL